MNNYEPHSHSKTKGVVKLAKPKESNYEGRDKKFVDVDRMINEGLGGGTTHGLQSGIIEESRGNLEEEDPPATK